MLYQTKETLVRPSWVWVLMPVALVLLSLFSYGLGYVNGTCEPCDCQKCPVGFASVEDMTALVDELEVCQNGKSRWD